MKVKNNNNEVTAILIVKSLFTNDFFIVNAIIIVVTPSTINVLNKFDPITLPTAISLLPFIDDITLTASSGALVPNDTIVNPTITDGIPIFFEIADAPDTKISAPFISKINPTTNKI